MSWNSSRKAHEEAPQGGTWFKLEDGQKADLCFLGEPLEVMEKADWNPSGEALRFQFNVCRIDSLQVQVWSLSPRVFGRLLSMHDEDQVANCKITAKRRGSGKDTEYDLFAKGKLDSKTLAKIKKLGLISLPAGEDTVAVESDEPAADEPDTADEPADSVAEAIAAINDCDDEAAILDVARAAWKAHKGDKAGQGKIMAAKDAAIEALDTDVPF